MRVDITGYDKVRRLLARLRSDVSTKQLTSKVGQFVQTSIKDRTQRQGVDVFYDSFEDYSEGHRRKREKKGLPVNQVDLTFTGSMFSAMTQEADNEAVRVFFAPTQDKSGMNNAEKAYYLNEGREFFGVTEIEEEEIVDMAIEHIDQLLRSGGAI